MPDNPHASSFRELMQFDADGRLDDSALDDQL